MLLLLALLLSLHTLLLLPLADFLVHLILFSLVFSVLHYLELLLLSIYPYLLYTITVSRP